MKVVLVLAHVLDCFVGYFEDENDDEREEE